MIRQTPIHFILVALLSLGLALFVVDKIYRLRIEGKDDLLSIYRERLGLSPYDKTKYSSLKNTEIKQQAIELAHKIHIFSERAISDSSAMSDKRMDEMRTAKTDEERRAISLKQTQQASAYDNAINNEYTENFKVDAILLRDEILSRLPRDVAASQRQDREIHKYEWPMSPILMNMVADHLEKIAKLLVD